MSFVVFVSIAVISLCDLLPLHKCSHLYRETKTVNSWFQNKRASCKKRHKGAAMTTVPVSAGAGSSASSASMKKSSGNSSVELPPISALIASVSSRSGLGLGPPPRQPEYDEYDEEEFIRRLPLAQQQQLFHAAHQQHSHFDVPEQNERPKARSRPSAAQTEELRKVYEVNPHPSKEAREVLGHKLGM